MAEHDPKNCKLCAQYRHPMNAKKVKELAEHLKTHPFPQQKGR